MMSKVYIKDGQLCVPDRVTVPYIEGDGVGAEITPVCQRIVNAAVELAYLGKRSIEWKEVLAGGKAFQQTGEWLPEVTMEAFREYLVGIKGPLTTPVGGGIRSLNVALRQTLDLYVCLRPVRWFRGVVSPVKAPEKSTCIFSVKIRKIFMQGSNGNRELLKPGNSISFCMKRWESAKCVSRKLLRLESSRYQWKEPAVWSVRPLPTLFSTSFLP